MPRDGSGTYTLPGGINPVISGTTIDIAWANPTLGDVATALTDSLSRTGSGGMLAPFLNADGAIGAPGIAWVNEPSMGIYRPNANEMRFVIAGVDRLRTIVDADNPVQVWVDSDTSFRTVLNIFSPYTIIGDWTWTGRVVTDDSTLTRSGFNIPTGVEPTVPVEGDMWKTAAQLFAYVNGAVITLGGSNIVGPSSGASTTLRGDGSGGWIEELDATISATGIGSFDGGMNTDGSLGIGDGVDNISVLMSAGLISTFGTGGVAGWGWNVDHFFNVDTKFAEHPSAPFDSAGYGNIWVENTVPNRLKFTGDGGHDNTVAMSGGVIGGNVSINSSVNFNNANVMADNFIGHYFDGANDTMTLADVGELDNWPLYTTINIIHQGTGNLTIVEGATTTLFLADGTDSVGGVIVSQGIVSITRQVNNVYVIWGSGIT